jgi:hypothetical protein
VQGGPNTGCLPRAEPPPTRFAAAAHLKTRQVLLSTGTEVWFFRTSCGEVCRPA